MITSVPEGLWRVQGGAPPIPTETTITRLGAHGSTHFAPGELAEEVQECILKCLDCRSICVKLAVRPSRRKDVESRHPDTRLLLNCSEICATAARFLLRGSDFYGQVCMLCAAVCRSCATQCGNINDDADAHACWLACRKCAECCERIAGVPVDAGRLGLALPE